MWKCCALEAKAGVNCSTMCVWAHIFSSSITYCSEEEEEEANRRSDMWYGWNAGAHIHACELNNTAQVYTIKLLNVKDDIIQKHNI